MKIMPPGEKSLMDFPPVGASLQKNYCSFAVWAPFRKKVEMVTEAGHRKELSPLDYGFWRADVPGVEAGAAYYYVLDGDRKLPDPASRAQLQGVHGPSTVVDPAYAWSDHGWSGLSLEDMIIYELHVGTFSNRHDFEGVISRLAYLKDLGVNAIELMPLAQFPGSRNWGYDGVYPFAVQASYGGAAGLKSLVNEAHRNGIAVILDVVYNHQGPEGNYFEEFGPYFTDKYKTGWGRAINFDDAWCDGVRHFYWQNALMWLDEFRIDGLRLDAVHAIWDNSARHFIAELATKVKALEVQSGRKKVLIAEFDLNNPRYITPASRGGYGLDGQWIDEFHHALHSLLTGETNGYYEDFGSVDHLVKALKDGYVYTGQYSPHRKKFFGTFPEGIDCGQFVVFAQNHDQIGNRMLGDRLSSLLSHEGLKLAAATFLLSPFVPLLFMGEEYGETRPFQYFISHTDEELVAAVHRGRKQEFSYFNWEGDIPAAQAEKTFNDCVLSWNVDSSDTSRGLLELYRFLIDLRKKRKALQGRSRDNLDIVGTDNRVISFERRFGGDCVLVVLNFDKAPVTYNAVYGDLRKILDSADTAWGGPRTEQLTDIHRGQSFTLYPESAVVFEL